VTGDENGRRTRRAGRPERPLDPDTGPVARFAWELRQLRARAGTPSYRDLAAQAHYAPSTLADATRGHRLPTCEVAVALAGACGGDLDEWTRRWHTAAASARPDGSTDTGADRQQGSAQPGRAVPGVLAVAPDKRVALRHRRTGRLLIGAGAGAALALLATLAAVQGRRRKTARAGRDGARPAQGAM